MKVLLPSLLLLSTVYGYVYDCLDRCECDTEDEVIHCHNGERTELKLPTGQRLRGFPVIGLTYNKIVTLPDEETLLSKFPDLKVVDVERNPDFDCDSLKNYDKVKIVSDCFKNATEVNKVPKTFRPTKDCDFSCQAQAHYDKLHEYVLNLWDIMKDKYQNFDMDTTLRQIKEFFIYVSDHIHKAGREIQTKVRENRNPRVGSAGEIEIEKEE